MMVYDTESMPKEQDKEKN